MSDGEKIPIINLFAPVSCDLGVGHHEGCHDTQFIILGMHAGSTIDETPFWTMYRPHNMHFPTRWTHSISTHKTRDTQTPRTLSTPLTQDQKKYIKLHISGVQKRVGLGQVYS